MTDTDTLMEQAAAAFKAQQYHLACTNYTRVIDDLLLSNANSRSEKDLTTLTRAASNRSACQTSLGQFDAARESAELCVRTRAAFAKGHARLAAALHGLRRYADAARAYREAAAQPDRTGAADPAEYARSAAEMDALAASGKGVVAAGDRDRYYATKHGQEGVKAAKDGDWQLAADLFTKAIKYERQSLAANAAAAAANSTAASASTSTPEICVLLCNRSSALCRLGGDANIEAALEDAHECIALAPGGGGSYAKGHARLVQVLVAAGRKRAARTALAAAEELFSGDAAAVLKPAREAVERAEAEDRAREEEAQKLVDEQRREFEHAQRARNQVGDAVHVDTLKRRKVDDGGDGAASFVGAAVAGAKHSVSYEYCKYCSQHGHSASACPTKMLAMEQQRQQRQNR